MSPQSEVRPIVENAVYTKVLEWFNHWVKKAILLHMMVTDLKIYSGDCMRWYDKIVPKFSQLDGSWQNL